MDLGLFELDFDSNTRIFTMLEAGSTALLDDVWRCDLLCMSMLRFP